MQIDIKTVNVVPIRQTFSHIARRLGADKPASRYQEAHYDLQPEVNFHYRPIWAPDYELYDARRTAIVMLDWYAFKDPRQFYYGTYTLTRSKQQDVMEKNIEFVEKWGLLQQYPEDIQHQIAMLLIPLRHAEWGANTNNCAITAYGFGTAITQAAMFQTVDRLGIAQYLTRLGLLLAGNEDTLLSAGKTLWLTHPAWQGFRRQLENMMVLDDWFELLVAQDLVLDGLVFPMFYQQVNAKIAQHGSGLSLLTEFMNTWFEENKRWVDAVIKIAAAESAENAALLSRWIDDWLQQSLNSLAPLAEEAFGHDASETMTLLRNTFIERVSKLGISLPSPA